MKEINYWEQFIHTGSVADYLQFKATHDGNHIHDSMKKNENTAGVQTGENPYAGICNRYGNRA